MAFSEPASRLRTTVGYWKWSQRQLKTLFLLIGDKGGDPSISPLSHTIAVSTGAKPRTRPELMHSSRCGNCLRQPHRLKIDGKDKTQPSKCSSFVRPSVAITDNGHLIASTAMTRFACSRDCRQAAWQSYIRIEAELGTMFARCI